MLPKSNTILPLPWFKRGKCYANWNFDHCCLPWLPAYIQNEKVTKCWPNLNRDRCGLAYFECLMLPFDTHHFVPGVQGGVFVFVFVFLYSFCATRFKHFQYPTKYRDPSSAGNASALCPISSQHLYRHDAPIPRCYRLLLCVATK